MLAPEPTMSPKISTRRRGTSGRNCATEADEPTTSSGPAVQRSGQPAACVPTPRAALLLVLSARNESMHPAVSNAAPASAATPHEIADSFLVFSITCPSFLETEPIRHRITATCAEAVHATVAQRAP